MNRGMTLMELTITIGISSILAGLILGISRHVNETTRIRQAQAALQAWSVALERWRDKFGEYPHTYADNRELPFDEPHDTLPAGRGNLSNLVENAGATIRVNGKETVYLFRQLLTPQTVMHDPWNVPYLYLPSAGHRAYKMVSCGPDGKSPDKGDNGRHDALDDITAER